VVASHGTSQLDGGLNPMRREEVGEIIDRQIEERARPPRRDATFVNGEADHFHEWLRERRRDSRRPHVTTVVAESRIRDRARDSGLQPVQGNKPPFQRRGRDLSSCATPFKLPASSSAAIADQSPYRSSTGVGIRTADAKLLASCSTRLPPVSRASSECSAASRPR